MSVSPDFAPNEPATVIRVEHAFFVEASFEALFYGQSSTSLRSKESNLISKGRFKASWKLITFLTIQQIAVLIGVAGNIDLIARSFVYNRNIPGGPVAYQQRYSNLPFSFAALAGFTIATWLQDGLLLCRAIIIWNGKYLAVFIFPFLIYLASIAFSLILLIQTGQQAGLIASLRSIPVPLIFFSLSVGMNIILSILIAGRLLYYRHTLTRSVGRDHALRCLPFAAMVIESAALYSAVGLAQVVSLRTDIAVATAIEGLYGVMTALAPHLIAYRMSKGEAWTRNTMHDTVMEYADSPTKTQDLEQSALARNSGEVMKTLPSHGRASSITKVSPMEPSV
ncbi:hypothetical protein JB92DRAFT_2833559 [Gautieria morchelliformis]|nr:hypothetical protein JB92DRAFT_2833559 [Gautieria morchelliformis]